MFTAPVLCGATTSFPLTPSKACQAERHGGTKPQTVSEQGSIWAVHEDFLLFLASMGPSIPMTRPQSLASVAFADIKLMTEKFLLL